LTTDVLAKLGGSEPRVWPASRGVLFCQVTNPQWTAGTEEIPMATTLKNAQQSGKSNGRSFRHTQRIKMHDKAAALEKLGRTLGLFKDRLEHTGRDGGPISLRQLLREIDGTTRGPPNSRIRDGGEG